MNLPMSDLPQLDLTVDLSRAIDKATIDLYALINQITTELGVTYVVIGATLIADVETKQRIQDV